MPVSLERMGVEKHKYEGLCASRQVILLTYSIHLTQYCAFSKKERFPCIYQDQVKIGLPWSMGAPRLMKEKGQKLKHS